ncbi:MAG: single-stranded DNA-binding protein [Lachnospiraceae bacterium]
MNKLTIIGNLTRDPESRTTPNGNNVCTFTVAVNRRQRSQDSESQPEADFFRVAVFGASWARICQQLSGQGP